MNGKQVINTANPTGVGKYLNEQGNYVNVDNTVYTTINFGVTPINEKTFNIINANCFPTSKIEIMQFFQNQSEENFGNDLDLFTECLTGSFNIIAVSREPFSRGIFNIKYKIL